MRQYAQYQGKAFDISQNTSKYKLCDIHLEGHFSFLSWI